MIESLASSKALVRKAISKKRASMETATRDKKSLTIAQRLFELDEFKKSKRILCFLSLPHEVQTDIMIRESFRLNKEVFVPLGKNKQEALRVARIPSLDTEFIFGRYGVREPVPKVQDLVSALCVDFVITPGLAFDIYGNRIGYGSGYYDRLFRELPRSVTKVGVGYGFQIIGSVPHSELDEQLHCVITENNTLKVPEFLRH